MRYNSKLFVAVALIFCFTFVAVGQTPESDETLRVAIPPTVHAQTVKRILTWYFKPSNQKKVITVVGDGLERSWLPKIKGIEFRLLTREETNQSGESVYVFREIEKLKGGGYEIPFGFGSLGSGYEGDVWFFRFSKRNVTLWKQSNAGWGASGIDYGPDYKDK
jgi:hypothetical protein